MSQISKKRITGRAFHAGAVTEPQAWVWLYGYKYQCLLDSGCNTNLISLQTVSELGLMNEVNRDDVITMCMADGSKRKSHGAISLAVTFMQRKETIKFQVCVSTPAAFPIIIGVPGLKIFNVCLNFSCAVEVKEEDFHVPLVGLNERKQMFSLLKSFTDLFNKSLGKTNILKHSINVGENVPIRSRPYRTPHALKGEITSHVENMLKEDIIRPSKSPWCSPAFLVRKKNGKWRFVVDYIKVNQCTVKDAMPLPNIDDMMMNLSGCKYFTTLDCANGYFQVPLVEESKEITAFEADGNLYEFNVMPFGLCNAPGTFQRLMQIVLAGCASVPYIDDIVVASRDYNQHLADISNVLTRLREAGLRLQISKCTFGADSVNYLGHIVSSKGLSPDPSKVKALQECNPPTSKKEVERFCGFVNYLSKFIPHLSELLHPIYLMKIDKGFRWDESCKKAFMKIKQAITRDTTLQFPQFHKPFILHVDASDVAAGAELSQDKPIAYFSRQFNRAERNYATTDREYCALIKALKHFKPYVYGYPIKIYTDHSALISMTKSNPKCGRHARYHEILAEFNYEIFHIPGKENISADFLSRIESSLNPEAEEFIPSAAAAACTNIVCTCGVCMSRREMVSQTEVDKVIAQYHNAGHFSTNKVRKAILHAGYWIPNLRRQIYLYGKQCEVCHRGKSYTHAQPKGSLPKLHDVQPREFVAIDIVGPLPAVGHFKYIVTMIDHATRWLVAKPATNIEAKTVAKIFKDNWLLQYGPPRVLHSDNGKQFISQVYNAMCAENNISVSNTTVYHPQGNSVLERVHGTLKDRLRCKILEGTNWVDSLTESVYNINRTTNATDATAFQLFFGFQPNVSTDWPTDKEKPAVSKLPCPRVIYPRIFLKSSPLSPRFGPPIQVRERLSQQLLRAVDGKIYHMSNCKCIF